MKKYNKDGVIKLEDVAALAGVAKSTVSRVLSRETTLNIREDTRKKILESAQLLGYSPDPRARALRTKRTRTLGIIVDEFDNPAYSTIIRGAQRAAIKRGYTLIILFTDSTFHDAELYRRLINDFRVDGILISTVTDPELIINLNKSGKPILLVNRQVDGINHGILLNYEKGTEKAVNYLTSMGHKHIGYVSGPLNNYTGQTRLKGFRAGLKNAGINFNPNMVTVCNYNWEESGKAFTEFYKSAPNTPTAICAANVVVASGVLANARKLGLSTPKDLSVIALTDSPFAEMHMPTITALRFPFLELGIEATNYLIDRIEDEEKITSYTSLEDVEVIERGSVGKV